MALYQRSVLSKYLKQQDTVQLQKAYKKYTKYFLSPAIQENIRNTKEEQYQGLFLSELFVKVLDYTLKPNTDFNLVAEYKNQSNARKADGAILKENVAIAVIELKGTKTKDLESIRRQAFDYKANQKGCIYVITSNFEKLRFYINDATEFEEFNLFELTEERFSLLYLCLQKDNILTNVPLQIKEASILEEEQITKSFYKDYSLFKRELYRDLVKRNGKRLKNISYAEFIANTNATEEETAAEYVRLEKNIKLTLFKKSQKLIDRFLFIFFAEDRDLLPPNSTLQILNKWKADIDFGDERPLFDLFKQYFRYLDKGRQGTTSRAEIYAYNGGLFKEDTIIDSLEIDNDLLYTYTYKLAKYDFESQVDVNILGHIFENSLNEIESINAEIQGADFDKQKSKRKKDGVFYTPKYITKYIVENTIGKLCNAQKATLGLKEEEYYKGRKNRQKNTIKSLITLLDEYRAWLLQLTICDPACGSGAFLNQALDFLISEHNYIDELKAKLLGGAIVFSDIENTVLENNIYGVDLNEESVEIAKLSLWLRTAQPRRKLNDLSSNIKCGNSLIDSKAVAGDKAFHWETQFPKVFKEKDKKAYHITTAIHDSRTSERMLKYKVRERREMGANPYPNIIYFTPEDDLLITQTIATIVKEDNLKLLAYNICADHIHLLLVCDIEEIPAIMQKIKSVTAKHVNSTREHTDSTREHTDITREYADITREHAPLRKGNAHKTSDHVDITREHAPLRKENTHKTREHAPLHKNETHTDTTREHTPLHKSKNKPLWQQKYSAPKEVTSEEQLYNTIKYIQTNRNKHELPKHNKEVLTCITQMCCSISQGFATEYTGGFDVIIGNPPYVFARDNFSQDLKDYYVKKYVSAEYQVNTYLLFIERTIKLIKNSANYGLIIPNAWLMVSSAKGLRNFILKNCSIDEIINLAGYSFEGVNVETIILIATKTKSRKENDLKVLLSEGKEFKFAHVRNQIDFSNNEGFEFRVFSNEESVELTKKLQKDSKVLDELVFIKAGLQAYEKNKGEPKQTAEDVKNRPYDYTYKFDENTHKYLEGKDVGRYFTSWSGQYLQYGKQLASPRTFNLFDGEKVIIREITGKYPNSIISTFTDKLYLFNRSNIGIIKRKGSGISLRYVVCVLNSKLMAYYFLKNTAKSVRKMFPKIILNDLRKFPFKAISTEEQKPFIVAAEKMLSLNDAFIAIINRLQTYLQHKFQLEKLSKKLQNWYELSFGEFNKELNKAIKATNKILVAEGKETVAELTKKDEFEWLALFEEKKKEAQELQTQIHATDKQIDAMVYELYGLTEDEIAIVEAS